MESKHNNDEKNCNNKYSSKNAKEEKKTNFNFLNSTEDSKNSNTNNSISESKNTTIANEEDIKQHSTITSTAINSDHGEFKNNKKNSSPRFQNLNLNNNISKLPTDSFVEKFIDGFSM
jgi:hypothetical protein